MSGICGQFNFDGAAATQADLRAMCAALAERGPERTSVWSEGNVGFGHTLLATTPELLYEPQPFVHSESGCSITADVRLDNRDDLLSALGLSDRRETIGDGELIIRTYLRWPEACLDKLVGDFAFALWDPRDQVLFCARDHFGLRPFYYHHAPGKHFAFGSDPRAILALPQVPYAINEGRIADFLVPELEWIDYTSSFFQDVFRLPPGHRVSVTKDQIRVEQYWKSEPVGPVGLSDDDYRQGFLEVFTQAVDARLRAPSGTVGAMLSGGMDSGSVVAVGKELFRNSQGEALPTYSAAQRPGVDCDESRAVYAAIEMPSISPTIVNPEDLADQYESIVRQIEEPFDGQCTMLSAIYDRAHADGRKVILDGAGGDVLLGEGSYIIRLLRKGHVKQALHEIRGECEFWGEPNVARQVLRYVRSAYTPEAIKKPARSLLRSKAIMNYLDDSLINRDFAARIDIEERGLRLRKMFPADWIHDYATERCNAILPNMTGGRERYARCAAAHGVEARDPFLDKRLVDFCSQLPGHLRLRDGWPKMILRELMQDRLPDTVRWMREKPHIGWVFNEQISRVAFSRGDITPPILRSQLGEYIDQTALAAAWNSFHDGKDAEAIHTAFIQARWLCKNVK